MKLGQAWLARSKRAAEAKLWTQDEYDLERGRTMREWEYDPVAEEPRGWSEGEYHRPRWWYSPPWKLSEPRLWGVSVYKCGDEWCNDTAFIVLPYYLGALTIRFRPGPLRTRDDGPCDDSWLAMGAPPCPFCRHSHMPHCLPTMLACPACPREFPSYTSTTSDWVGVIGKDSNYYCSTECAQRGGSDE